MAVGDYESAGGSVLADALAWNGKEWLIQPVPRPVKDTWLYGVSCTRASACTAVGFESGAQGAQPLAEAWNGTTWHVQKLPLPHRASGGILNAVSCTAPSACTATGTHFGGSGRTLAEAALAAGFYISISGIVTFRNAEELRAIVRDLPVDRLLVETDAPYLAPVPYRGKRNEPAFVAATAAAVAALKGLQAEDLAEITSANFFRLFAKASASAR